MMLEIANWKKPESWLRFRYSIVAASSEDPLLWVKRILTHLHVANKITTEECVSSKKHLLVSGPSKDQKNDRGFRQGEESCG